MVDVITVTVEAPQNPSKAIDLTGPAGDPGDNGLNGWSPVFAAVADGARRVQRVIDWTGGQGVKPAVGKYIGPTGFVDDIASAVDIRGAEGAQGPQGPAGADGAVIIGGSTAVIVGDGAPNDADGVDDQLYFDRVNNDLYQKVAGHWTLQANLKGEQGPAGPAGPAGADGADGLTGSDGAPGVDGATIRTGLGVPNDAVGKDGDLYIRTANADMYQRAAGVYSVVANLKGPAGADGATGPAGADGAPGPTLNPRGAYSGATTYAKFDSVHVAGVGEFYSLVDANVGNAPATSPSQWYPYAVDGSQGAAGADGADGATGNTGAPGTAATVAVGTTTTGAAGTSASVTNSGTSSAAVLEFTIPQGAKGDQGIQGPAGPAPINAADITINIFGKMNANQKVFKQTVVRSFTLAAGLAGSVFTSDVAATASYTMTLYKNGASIGTLVWGAGATTPTVTFASAVTFAVNDVFTITGAATADATLADISLNFYGTR